MEERIREILREDEDAVGDLVDLITEYQARAWDKGFGEGATLSHWWDTHPGRSNKEHKNPYRKQQESNGRR